MWSHLKFVYEVLNRTVPNWIAQNHAMQRQTKACVIKSSCEIFALVRYYAAYSINSVPMFQDNLLIPSSEIKSERGNRAWLKLTDTVFLFWAFVHRLIV